MNWPTKPAVISLAADEVHAWTEAMGRHLPEIGNFFQILELQEQKRAARFIYPQHRQQFIIAHGLLRSLLGLYLDLPPERVKYRYGNHGKPFLVDEINPKRMQFNMSHSGGVVMVGVTHRRRIGVDIEEIRQIKDLLGLAKRYFSPCEYETLLGRSMKEQRRQFYSIWTQKEAYIKGIGKGLSVPLDSFDVPHLTGGFNSIASFHPTGEKREDWGVQLVSPLTGFVGAIAAEGGDWTLKFSSLDASVEESDPLES